MVMRPPDPIKATFSLLLADFPGLPMANVDITEPLASAAADVVRKVLRFMVTG